MGIPPVQIINAPFDLSGRMPGSRLGPAAVHLAGLSAALGRLGVTVKEETGWTPDHALAGTTKENGARSLAKSLLLKDQVTQSIEKGFLPIVLGGDHSLAAGSVSGAIATCGDDLGVLWIDAHTDLNTPSQSHSKNLHGMPLAALLRLPEQEPGELKVIWERLLSDLVPNPGLRKDSVAWFGLRSVDPGEEANLNELDGALALTMEDIDSKGIAQSVAEVQTWIEARGIKKLWISFDVDALDPIHAPGTGTTVRGGLTYREGHYLAECLHQALFGSNKVCDLVGLDVVEVNPLLDQNNETARLAVGWVESLFGQRIFRRKTSS